MVVMTNTERESIVSVDTDLATLRRRLQFKSDMAALDRVEAELSRLREMLHGPDRVGQMWRRVEAAEARCARLQQALEDSEGRVLAAGKRIETLSRERQVLVMRNSALQDKLLGLDTSPEALAGQPTAAEGPDTPADSKEDKT